MFFFCETESHYNIVLICFTLADCDADDGQKYCLVILFNGKIDEVDRVGLGGKGGWLPTSQSYQRSEKKLKKN